MVGSKRYESEHMVPTHVELKVFQGRKSLTAYISVK
jgi:hypothetical protein